MMVEIPRSAACDYSSTAHTCPICSPRVFFLFRYRPCERYSSLDLPSECKCMSLYLSADMEFNCSLSLSPLVAGATHTTHV